MTLQAVPQQPTAIIPLNNGIPRFENKDVHTTAVAMSSTAALDTDDVVLSVDEIVSFKGEGRVLGVAHIVNEKTGQLTRVQRIKVLEIEVVPWEPA